MKICFNEIILQRNLFHENISNSFQIDLQKPTEHEATPNLLDSQNFPTLFNKILQMNLHNGLELISVLIRFKADVLIWISMNRCSLHAIAPNRAIYFSGSKMTPNYSWKYRPIRLRHAINVNFPQKTCFKNRTPPINVITPLTFRTFNIVGNRETSKEIFLVSQAISKNVIQ